MPKKRVTGKRRGPYARWYGDAWRHPKLNRRSLAAIGLHVQALSYSVDTMSDGVIPKRVMPALAGNELHEPLVAELLTCLEGDERPLWEDKGEHYQILSYVTHNITKGEWEAEKDRVRDAVSEHRKRNGNKPVTSYKEPCNESVTGMFPSPSLTLNSSSEEGCGEGPAPDDELGAIRVVVAWDRATGGCEELSSNRHRPDAIEVYQKCKAAKAPPRDVVDCWQADPWVKDNSPGLGHLAKNFHKYIPRRKEPDEQPPDPQDIADSFNE